MKMILVYWRNKGIVGVVTNAAVLMLLIHIKQDVFVIRFMGLLFFWSLYVMLRDNTCKTNKVLTSIDENFNRLKEHHESKNVKKKDAHDGLDSPE